MMTEYQERDENLKSLGYASYSAYLQSDLWKSIRDKIFEKSKGSCIKCGQKAGEIHHSCYSIPVLSGKALHGMYAVCYKCHQNAELSEDGKKRSIDKTNQLLGIDVIERFDYSFIQDTNNFNGPKRIKGAGRYKNCKCGNSKKKYQHTCDVCRRSDKYKATPKKAKERVENSNPASIFSLERSRYEQHLKSIGKIKNLPKSR